MNKTGRIFSIALLVSSTPSPKVRTGSIVIKSVYLSVSAHNFKIMLNLGRIYMASNQGSVLLKDGLHTSATVTLWVTHSPRNKEDMGSNPGTDGYIVAQKTT